VEVAILPFSESDLEDFRGYWERCWMQTVLKATTGIDVELNNPYLPRAMAAAKVLEMAHAV